MTKTRDNYDSVRASRDGHEFHEAWVARKCLGLLLPKDDFIGLAIEGFSPADQKTAEDAGNEIADAVLYYGDRSSFEHANQVVVVQVKYSKASEDKPFRAADAKKTIEKFAKTYRSHKRKHGTEQARAKLRFELVTNRPILTELYDAIAGMIAGAALRGTVKDQADQIQAACKLQGKDLAEFVYRLHFTGVRGDLRESKNRLAIALADWSAARDPLARVRLNSIRELARDKANLANQNRNVISRADVLTALELQDENDLLPCPACFPNVGPVLERSQLSEVVAKIPLLDSPLVIHADGGVGKTVFMNSIASRLANAHEIVLFDCFGMGQYRAPGDARHLPRKGLVHIVNELACRGLCDPLLPGTDDSDDLIRAFRLKIGQAAETVRRVMSDRQLIILLDAIDNAGEQAKDRGEPSFPELLLASINHGGALTGVQLVVSSRSHRRVAATGGVACEEFELKPFTIQETGEFLRQRLDGHTEARIHVAQSRSRGNARVLEHLVSDGATLLAPSEIDKVIQLDDLLRKRIEDALKVARKQGYRDAAINAFLAGLAALPPPVPLREFAEASGLDEGAVASFAADLSPLLEQTKHGLMFRDEPTETLIREQYCADKETLGGLARNLLGMQATSIYAAITLPDLLQQLEDGEKLFDLAFDERIPAAIKSAVSRQSIRHARLRAASAYAADRNEVDRLVPLLVELSTLAAMDQRGTSYILDNPDLTVLSSDADSVRRLFELRTNWPGTRHARLAIAYGLDGDLADAYHHSQRVIEWRTHWLDQHQQPQREKADPTALDMAAIPFCHLVKGETEVAARDMSGWVDWFAFDVAESLLSLLRLGAHVGTVQQDSIRAFLTSTLLGPGVLAASIPFVEEDESLQQLLISRLAQTCGNVEKVRLGEKQYGSNERRIIRGLLRCASISLVQGMKAEARTILSALPIPAPSLHVYTSNYWSGEIHSFLAMQALLCAASDEDVIEQHLLPQELAELVVNLPAQLQGTDFKKAMKSELEKQSVGGQTKNSEKKQITADTKSSAMRFLSDQLEHWLQISIAFAACFDQRKKTVSRLSPLLDLWPDLLNRKDYRSGGVDAQRQRFEVSERLLTLAFEADPSLDQAEVVKYLEAVEARGITNVSHAIEIVSVLAVRPALQISAGTTAIKVKMAIEKADDVSQRASFFADLARAISPASRHESTDYFHRGLEQMDAVGSGDYKFVNELMQFASSLQGEELSDEDSHTLSNICELNLGEENKFNWGMYGMAMAKVSGLKGLAKLARWEDRGRISLDYTLLPYVRALIHCGKIDPAIAIAILRVSSPAELWVCGTEQLVESLESQQVDHADDLTEELITQYKQNNPNGFGAAVPRALARLAKATFGDSNKYGDLSAMADQIEVSTREFNDLNNWRTTPPVSDIQRRQQTQVAAESLLTSLVIKTVPVDELSIANAMEELKSLSGSGWGYQRDFFERLQVKVPYGEWPQYLTLIARQGQLELHEKLRILSACKEAWSKASNTVASTLTGCAEIIIRQHVSDFVSFDYLSISDIAELSKLSLVDRHSIILALIREFCRPSAEVSASVWLALASAVNTMAASGVGQAAVQRLLNTGAAKLASSVVDGAWRSALHPIGNQTEVAAGLIWFALGSAQAERRWMAAHSLRVAVRLGRSEILDKAVMKFSATCADSFQAQELPFFHLHAKLWLLIALARIALDEPKAVAKHHAFLERIALSAVDPHVLFKHFSAEALLSCARSGHLNLSQTTLSALQHVNQSQFLLHETKKYSGGFFYKSRPEGTLKKQKELHLEYDFGKYDVSNLGGVFGKEYWFTADAMNDWVRKHDADITHMSDQGGRSVYRRGGHINFSADQHTYGGQLCWHALHGVAGEFLAKYAVSRRPYDEGNPWYEWLSRRVLTRKDGLWLADGTDWRPMETRINLRDVSGDRVGITGEPSKLQSLLGIDINVGDWMVVDGDWKSVDGIDVHINSALVSAEESLTASSDLASKDPFQAYIPRLDEYDDTNPASELDHPPFVPWVVNTSPDAGIDETDPFGVVGAAERRKLSSVVNAFARIAPLDPYGRSWADPSGSVLMRCEVWCQEAERNEGDRSSGARMLCRSDLIRNYLAANNAHLVLLIVLRQYEPGFGDRSSQFKHTTAVVRVTESLDFTYHRGRTNELHEND